MNSAVDSVFIDTWGWLALGHKRDSRHEEVKETYEGLRSNNTRIFTSDYVLDELITLLFRRENYSESSKFVEALLAAMEMNYLFTVSITKEYFEKAWELRKKYRDKQQISFTDFTSMVAMRQNAIKHVFTDDDHFTHVGMDFVKIP